MNLLSEVSRASFVGDDPESVKRLRKLVVVLAISGRLSAPGDTCAKGQTIASQIDEAKRQLVAKGILRKCEATLVIAPTDLPDVLPASACFVRLGSVAKVEKGLTGDRKSVV